MSSGFISESEIAEKRKCRQEEWEKVRRPDQPLEAPEEDYDHRSLFDRLQEQKQKRDFEYEEAHRLKHMIKGLDDDEVEFLDLVDRSKLEEERKKRGEEAREMASFRSAVASLHEQSLDQRIRHEIKSASAARTANTCNSSYTSQTKLLAGAVVKKRPANAVTLDGHKQSAPLSEASAPHSPPAKKAKTKAEDTEDKSPSPPSTASTAVEEQSKQNSKATPTTATPTAGSGLQCIGILPGISYSESSSDSCSSSEDSDGGGCCDEGGSCQGQHSAAVDMIGRKLFFKQKLASESAE